MKVFVDLLDQLQFCCTAVQMLRNVVMEMRCRMIRRDTVTAQLKHKHGT